MIQSMTGYGKAVVTYKEKKINVEIKSLNSKTVDMSTRIASDYRALLLTVPARRCCLERYTFGRRRYSYQCSSC